jgi:cytochrome P450
MANGRPNAGGRSLISTDPPEHMKYRLLTQSWFMPKHLKTLTEQIGAIADKSVAKLRSRNKCDFVEDIALYYPLEVVMLILGVPETDLPFMLRLTQEVFAPLDPDSMPAGIDPSDPSAMALALKSTTEQLERYFSKITEDRRANPRNDIASIIANATIDGQPMSPADMLGYYAIIATAGHDTTSSSTSAAMYALATQPEMFRRVKADPTLIPKLVEEAIRWASPVKTFMRSPTERVEYGGRVFEPNDWLMLCYASANRDEAVFDHGERFDIDRPKSDHLAFGFGPHVCLGQHLARREMIMLFERLLPALKSVEIDGEPKMTESFFVSGLKSLPIRYELENAPVSAPV